MLQQGERASCSICTESFADMLPDTVIVELSNCNHAFCEQCLMGWWNAAASSGCKSCPDCRRVYSGLRHCLRSTAGELGAPFCGAVLNSRLDCLLQTAGAWEWVTGTVVQLLHEWPGWVQVKFDDSTLLEVKLTRTGEGHAWRFTRATPTLQVATVW